MRVAWIGTGVMGRSMALHLINAGHELRITTRTKDRAADVLAAGATWCATPAEAAESCDMAISMVGYPSDVDAVHRGADGTPLDGALSAMRQVHAAVHRDHGAAHHACQQRKRV